MAKPRTATNAVQNYASLHRDALTAAIESGTVAELRAIDADLAREGWDAKGQARSRIAERLSASPKSTKE
jgi:hypothetical protein